MKTGGEQLQLAWILQQITRQLLDGELVERHVVANRADHPISVRPHHAVAVDRVTVRVGKASLVEPMSSPAFRVVWRVEQIVHHSQRPRLNVSSHQR